MSEKIDRRKLLAGAGLGGALLLLQTGGCSSNGSGASAKGKPKYVMVFDQNKCVGCGDCKDNAKALDNVIKEISAITGQHAVATVARKSVANFKLREGMVIGAKVTLRGDRMYEFLDRFFNLALPRVRDFRGINPNSFDGRGNYSLGIKEQLIFPEIEYDKIDKVRGMDICFVTTANTDEEARELLTLMGAPFAK